MTRFVGYNTGCHDGCVSIYDSESDDLRVYLKERFTKKKYEGFHPIGSFLSLIPSEAQKVVNTISDETKRSFTLFGRRDDFQQKLRLKMSLHQLGSKAKSTILPELNTQAQFYTHHKCHLYSVLARQPFRESIIFVYDGFGSSLEDVQKYSKAELEMLELPKVSDEKKKYLFESVSVYLHEESKITCIHKEWISINRPKNYEMGKELNKSPMSLFESSSVRIFNSVMESGKVMGLAAYGKQSENLVHEKIVLDSYKNQEKKGLNDISKEDFSYYADIAKYTQDYFEQYLFELIKKIKKQYPTFTCASLVGGGSLNCVFNAKLIDENIFDDIYTPAWSNDSGTAIGASFCDSVTNGEAKIRPIEIDSINPFVGDEVKAKLAELQILFGNARVTRPENLEVTMANLISKEELVAVFRGRSEVGPRALGNRSIIAPTSKKDIITYLNDQIKFREKFRPYGIIMLDRDLEDFFESGKRVKSPFMSFAPKVLDNKIDELKNILHADNTLRVQTVNKSSNKFYSSLLEEVYKLTGDKMIINTSLNVKGQPILRTIEDCQEFFMNSKIKYFVINDFLVEKK